MGENQGHDAELLTEKIIDIFNEHKIKFEELDLSLAPNKEYLFCAL